VRLLGGRADPSFARAETPRELEFPADHGSHPEYQTEWWYFTGNVTAETGRHFGFELTFFRYALSARPAESPRSAWRSTHAWMAHFAITDTAAGRFRAAERRSRQVLQLAGTTVEPLRVWVKDWSLEEVDGAGALALRLHAEDERFGLALALSSSAPPIAHGDRGLSRKGSASGNATYYYSVPRLEARGTLTVDGETFAVSGLAWLDREWGTSSLEPDIAGWDWFGLNLSDGSSLMFYRLRTASRGASPFSSGSWIGRAGVSALSANDVSLTALDEWTSPATGSRYPIAWRLTLPREGLELEVRPYLEAQEINQSVRYWEGAVRGEGIGPQGRITAEGYLELTGY
jgi:predicted secreted hydrolase